MLKAIAATEAQAIPRGVKRCLTTDLDVLKIVATFIGLLLFRKFVDPAHLRLGNLLIQLAKIFVKPKEQKI
jgi:hypothetical protein